jgi:hypothetical protein
MNGRALLSIVSGTALFAIGLSLIYGSIADETLPDSGLLYPDALLSPGIALMGAGLFLVIGPLVRSNRSNQAVISQSLMWRYRRFSVQPTGDQRCRKQPAGDVARPSGNN